MSEAEKGRILAERKRESESLGQIGTLREDLKQIREKALPELLDSSSRAASGAGRVEGRMLDWMQTIANPQSRGAFGELAVENQLQSLGLELGRDYMKQVTSDDGARRPDYIVRTGQGSVIVDAKFALDESLAGLGDAAAEDGEALVPYGRKLKARAEELAKRDYSQMGERGLVAVLLYVPVEGAHEALKALPGFSLERFCREHRVYIVTPSQLPLAIGLVAEVAHVVRRGEQVDELGRQMLGLAGEVAGFCDQLAQHGKHLGTAYNSYNKLVASASTRGGFGRRVRAVLEFAGERSKLEGEVHQLDPPRDDAADVAERWREAG
jgi:DNA anti-recombination protein RmuC